ncbi:hypothetical protein QMZ30_11575 [Pantoea sp. EA-12]|uniref:hypothetical protein n=1 Tax=Pantoea sp. EA-12 TaxID=3043303 RepID=UPI0024B5BD77|nr:hypothetical protein [Pantoea sp. EA-12]MDI9221538.1 hypothetical protein [Pantoea sp. EA-12]
MKLLASGIIFTLLSLTCSAALAAATDDARGDHKLDDDPTKITTKAGVSWSDTYDMDDSNVSFSGSIALDKAKKLNARINSDASEWRIGGSWLFPVGIVNFNFGKNEYTNGATQTNYSVGTFIPLSYFGFAPGGFQIFPMAGYTYNTGEVRDCQRDDKGACISPQFAENLSPESNFETITTSGSSGYLGAFTLKPLTPDLTMIAFAAGSYGSKNDEGENYHGYFGGIGLGYSIDKHNSINVMTFIMDNNTYLDSPDNRFVLSYKYQFN